MYAFGDNTSLLIPTYHILTGVGLCYIACILKNKYKLKPKYWLPLLVFGAVLICQSEARRVRVQRPQEEDEEETVNYYAAEPQEDQRRVVLVSSADQYNGYYGQPTAASRSAQDNYIQRGSVKGHELSRTKETAKAPPVQTIRNYNKVNDDGSFTFGYESADGSFKEETRGTDCVVRGKYGYVDPDGNKREFTYVSGNPCDPNAPKDQDDSPEDSNETENDSGPANYPRQPVIPIQRPAPTAAPKPAVALFQNNYAQSEEEQPEPEQLLRQQPIRRPAYISRPQYLQHTQADSQRQVYQSPQVVPTTTPASVIYKSINITPRPVSPTPSARTQLPATTYRPQLLQVTVTPRPSLYYSKPYQPFVPSPTTAATPGRGVDFDSEFQKFQLENNVVSPTPTPATSKVVTTARPKPVGTAGQVYSTALVYDPTSGQYNNQVYQTLPQTEGDFLLKQRIQPYVFQPQQRPTLNFEQLQQQSPLYNPRLRTQPASQAAYQAQQSEVQFQNSAQLYAQQQRARQQQQQQQQQRPSAPQPVYYIQPSSDQTGALATSQLDAFLRGHNIQF
ncbi:hypothetical protein NQ317_010612 [Molorchus minor]|uniref:Uncharacterized protein n=1 Tax=Molorchus minor TaxID=1323400 RepID=A0ABQ9J9D8_9CUCU|nr:hypothetical protein NQ317_010612 [Molorchus minor]